MQNKKGKECKDCKHESCPMCTFCHNQECLIFAMPVHKCYDLLLSKKADHTEKLKRATALKNTEDQELNQVDWKERADHMEGLKEVCGLMIHTWGFGLGKGAAYCAETLPYRFHTKGPDGLSDIDRELKIKNEALKPNHIQDVTKMVEPKEGCVPQDNRAWQEINAQKDYECNGSGDCGICSPILLSKNFTEKDAMAGRVEPQGWRERFDKEFKCNGQCACIDVLGVHIKDFIEQVVGEEVEEYKKSLRLYGYGDTIEKHEKEVAHNEAMLDKVKIL